MSHPRTTRFTLIELLVVVGIIIVLAAILLPVLGKAKSTARSARCNSNMKQLGNGIAFYQDSQQEWPDANYGLWVALLGREMNVPIDSAEVDTVFKCPSNSDHNTDVYPGNVGYGLENTRFYGDIVINNYVAGGAFGYAGMKEVQIKDPYSTILLADGTIEQAIYPVVYQDYVQFYFDGTSGKQRLAAPHGGGINLAYVDGHVERFLRHDVVDSQDAPYTSDAFRTMWDPSLFVTN